MTDDRRHQQDRHDDMAGDEGRDGPIAESDLHAWIDGELPPRRAAAVEAYLADRPEDLARLDSYRAHADLIARAFAPLAAPSAAPSVAAAFPAVPKAPRLWLRPIAAAAALFVAGAAAGWTAGWTARGSERTLAGAAADTPRFAADALSAHLVFAAEVRHPVEVTAEQEAHLIAWLSRRLGAPLTAPRLAAAGFELMGGRLLPGDGDPAAQFMYQNAAGLRVTLYVHPSPNGTDTSFRFAHDGGAAAFYWKDRGLSWALSGEMDRSALQELAHRVYAALNS